MTYFDSSIRKTFKQTKIMTIKTQIKKHERCLELLEAMQTMKNRIEMVQDSLKGFAGTFPQLKRKLENDLDTKRRVIQKLSIKYQTIN
jgi:hypothetical protein